MCGFEKYQSEFHTHKTRGLQSDCKSCRSEYNRRHYQKNKKKYIESSLKSRQNKKDFIRDLKDLPCKDCGIKYPYYVMQFDHLRDKSFSIASEGWAKSIDDIKEEVEKCEVVCANCHAQRTYERRSGTNRDSNP